MKTINRKLRHELKEIGMDRDIEKVKNLKKEGLTNSEIASKLDFSESTVRILLKKSEQ